MGCRGDVPNVEVNWGQQNGNLHQQTSSFANAQKRTWRNIVLSFEYWEHSTFKPCSRVQTIHLSFEDHATVPQPILATGVAHVASPRTGKHRLKTTWALRCQDFWLFQSELNHLCIVHLQSPSAVPIGTQKLSRQMVTYINDGQDSARLNWLNP